MCLMFLVLSLSLLEQSSQPCSGQGQMAGVKVLERPDDWQCASMEERERAKK